jgi:hypothetical protein
LKAGRASGSRLSIPPQHGKTIHLSQIGLSWIWGKNPRKNIVVVTYNQTRADELGHEFRQMIKDNPVFRQVFPEGRISGLMQNQIFHAEQKRREDLFLSVSVVRSPVVLRITLSLMTRSKVMMMNSHRQHLRRCGLGSSRSLYSRGSNKTKICVIHTRWNEDDMIGRLCDPTHPERNKRFAGIADDWEFMNIPGVIRDDRLAKALGLKLEKQFDQKVIDQFGLQPCTALWPKEKSLEFFAQWKRGDPTFILRAGHGITDT